MCVHRSSGRPAGGVAASAGRAHAVLCLWRRVRRRCKGRAGRLACSGTTVSQTDQPTISPTRETQSARCERSATIARSTGVVGVGVVGVVGVGVGGGGGDNDCDPDAAAEAAVVAVAAVVVVAAAGRVSGRKAYRTAEARRTPPMSRYGVRMPPRAARTPPAPRVRAD